jgi:cellulose synthase/poly-beta-1,6-N-acetylglucosamine synthase-like glycosyltransferase
LPVDENLPSVTVLIAARPGQAVVKAVPAAQALDYPAAKLEIILARGKQPSAQRNTALKAARGELLYFLDDDSVGQPQNLRRAITHFTRPEVVMVGGPNLCPPDAPALEQVFALVLASWALGPSRARYAQVGRARETSEKELILCNLVARRDAMLRLGGFNEALYPNEENALMDELQKSGAKLIYDPDLIVHRRPRPNLRAFVRMLMTYGRGRAEQFRLHPTAGSALNFVPPAFLVYLLFTIILLLATPSLGKWFLIPLAFYVGAVLGQAVLLALVPPLQAGQHVGWIVRISRSAAAIPLIILTHLLYGFGFWRGLFTPLKPGSRPPAPPVVLETVTP